jgi:hypothetical protein
MEAGTYKLRPTWSSPSPGDRYLSSAVIELEESGTVFVHIDGEPLFAFPHLEAFLGAHTLSLDDLEHINSA